MVCFFNNYLQTRLPLPLDFEFLLALALDLVTIFFIGIVFAAILRVDFGGIVRRNNVEIAQTLT